MKKYRVGLVGVGGCHFLPSAPAYWSQSPYLSIYNIDNDNGTLREKDVNFYYRDGVADVVAVDALKLATEAGSPKAVNVVLIGVLSKLMDIPEEAWLRAIDATVPPKFLELNRKAFALGRNA